MASGSGDYRSQSRSDWDAAASGWKATAGVFGDTTMPVAEWMVDAIHPQPGFRVLELAAGLGEVGFLAAELIQPGGELICSDFSPGMLTAAQERSERLGLQGVRFKQVDAESIDVPAATLDAVLCRFGYMLMADGEAALRETRRVLKPGGRVALAVWDEVDANPWNTLAAREMLRRGLIERPEPGKPGPFTWAEPGFVEERLHGAGFVDDIEVATVDFAFDYPDAQAWWNTMIKMSQRFSQGVAGCSREQVDEIRAAVAERARDKGYVAEDGSVSLPARAIVAAATA